MPIPAAVVAAGLTAVGQGVNAYATGKMNKKNREWASNMYAQQRDDNLRFWNMQNEYNSPENQMRLYRQAGLNPNLIYGNGDFAKASQLSAPGSDTPRTEAPQWGNIGEAVNTYFNTQRQQQALAIGEQELLNKKEEQQYIHNKAISEFFKPEYIKAATGKTLLDTDQSKQKFATLLEGMELTNMRIKQLTNTAKAQETYLGAQTSVVNQENQRRNARLALDTTIGLQKVAESIAKEKHTYEDINRLKQTQRLLGSQAFLNEMEGLYRTAGSSFNFNTLERTLHMPTIDKVMKELYPNWDKMTTGEKMNTMLLKGVTPKQY